MLKKEVTTQTKLSATLGKSEAWISKMLTIARTATKQDEDGLAVLRTYTDIEKLYQIAREVLGLHKKQPKQIDLEVDGKGKQAVIADRYDEPTSSAIADKLKLQLEHAQVIQNKDGSFNVFLSFSTKEACETAFGLTGKSVQDTIIPE